MLIKNSAENLLQKIVSRSSLKINKICRVMRLSYT